MHPQTSYSAEPVFRRISEHCIEKNLRILIDLLQFEREMCDTKLGSFALRQSRGAYTQRERKLFLVQTDACWDGGQHFDLGDDVRGDRVRIVLGTRYCAGRRNGIKRRTTRRERKAVEHYPAAFSVEDVVSREEGRAEGRYPRWAERIRIREARASEEVVLGA